MIQVVLAPEPVDFDAKVRQKGLSAIDEMVGRKPRLKRTGPKRKKTWVLEQDIPANEFLACWRDCLPELLISYERRCAFLSLYLEHSTGNASVDHMLPKSKHWEQVYEWNNYRLCAATINSRKNDLTGMVDPVDCRPNWFALELVGFQVIAGEQAPARKVAEINATLELVNGLDCCRAREEYVTRYWDKEISLRYLERRAPFIAAELRRQGRLLPGDV
ncbi:MAG: hypothetical protein K9N47_29610 [Prosthecobacter sp.]|uniref:hypothetical protein n=1 Tax=Prosthecobacter sp. TaxID=1965333 RepID=UPI002603B0F1|nr:hypothetical protein [Prosthecobacter sp.]MCF7790313.1 hypothetical protein [Prosthecobacter sp.]